MIPSTRLLLPFIALAALAISGRDASAAENSGNGRHLFILSGQSNMREPLIGTFSAIIKKALGEDRVIVASFGQPSQPIRSWYRNWRPPEGVKNPGGTSVAYDRLMAAVRKAVSGQKLESTTLVWMQGEEDARLGWASRYEESFTGVLDQIKADLGIQRINFVIGRINDYWLPSRNIVDGEAMRALQAKIGGAGDHGAWINTDDLNTGVNPWGSYEIDGGHFPNAGYRVMGQRFARQACKLADPTAKPDETLFAEAFPDDVRKVKSNLALGKPITGIPPDASHAGGKAGLASLVDGKTGATDPADPAWLAYPPTEKTASFTIDLGAPVELTSVAVNLLVHQDAAARFPVKIDVQFSPDGSDYKHLLSGRSNVVSFDKHARQQNLSKDFQPRAAFIYVEKQAVSARYVKVEIDPDSASGSWLFLDEIMINPVIQ